MELRSYRTYSAHKETSDDWLGQIPTHWSCDRLKHLATVNDDTLPETTGPNVEILYVDIGSVDPKRGITEKERFDFAKAPTRARRTVKEGDVIVSTVRTYLRAIAPIVTPEPNLVVSTGFAVIRPKAICGPFASYALRAPYFVDRVVANSEGVTFPAISAHEMANISIAYPPIEEQLAIAAFLDRETGRIDALVEKKKELIKLLNEQRTALITHAVTKGLDPEVEMKDSQTYWLGEIPEHWMTKRLWLLTPPSRKIMYGIVLPGPNVKNGVPIVKGGDVAPGRLLLRSLSKTRKEIEARYRRSRLRGGDLVISIRGSIGEVEVVPNELNGANVTQDAARISPVDSISGRWLLYALRSNPVFAQLESGAVGATIRGINIRDLKRASVPVPPLREQRAIAKYLDVESARLDKTITHANSAIRLLMEFRTALISAAVTGKIDVREEVQ